MTRFLTNPAPSEPVPIEIKLGWTKLAVRVQSIFDQDLTDIAFSIDNTNILKRPYTTEFLELDFGATPGATYTLVVGSVDAFVGADNDLLMAGILGNPELVRTYKQEITFREYPLLDSVTNTITRNAFTANNLVVTSSGFAEFMDVEYSIDNIHWVPLYSGGFNTNLIENLPLGSYHIRVRYSINIVTNIDVTPWQYSTVTVSDLGTSLVEEMQDEFDSVKDSIVSLDNDFKVRLAPVEIDLKSIGKQVLSTAEYARQIQQQTENLKNAFFYVDPESGTITNLAYAYTDNQFTQAGLLIDGVNAAITLQAQKVTQAENRITNAESSISLLSDEIDLRATFTDVNQIVAGAIDAITPAYSFGFFSGPDGWSPVSGTLTHSPGKLALVVGDITNQSLSYSADENPVITISVERTAGTGWVGTLVVTFESGPAQTYPASIEDIPIGGVFVRNLNLAETASYTGTVTGLRFILGQAASDTFTVSSITVGKPSAALAELEGLTAQVNQLGINIDAVEGQLTNYVTTTFYNANTVTQNNLELTLNGLDSYIELQATKTELDNNNTVTKANTAAIWVDAAESNITSVVSAYVDPIEEEIDSKFVLAQEQIDASRGLISNQVIAISGLQSSKKESDLNILLSEYQLYLREKGQLTLGTSIATANSSIQAVSNQTQAVAQSILDLEANFGTSVGQINASLSQTNQALATETQARADAISTLTTNINGQFEAQSNLIQSVQSDVSGNSTAIAGLSTRVGDVEDFSQAQLILNSEYNTELDTLESRAFLGTTNVVGGKATISGLFVGGIRNSISFQGDIFELANTSGQRRLYWDDVNNTWVFNGRLVVGGYEVTSEEDIRALDGTSIRYIYRENATQLATPPAINLPNNWSYTPPSTTAPIWVSQATFDSAGNIVGTWSYPVRWNGLQGAGGSNAKVVKLVGNVTAVSYNAEGTGRSVNAISFVATPQNVNTPFYRFYVNDQAQGTAATTTSTFSYAVPTTYFANPVSIEVEVREGSATGTIVARDEVTVYAVKDGKDTYVVVMSNESHAIPTDSDGNGGDFTGSGTNLQVFQGSVALVFGGASSSYPAVSGTYNIQRASAGLTSAAPTGVGTTTLVQPDYTGMSVDSATCIYTIRVRNQQGFNVPVITKSQSLVKSKRGTAGAAGLNSATLTAYKRSASAPTDNAGNVTYTFATSAWTPANNWSKTIPATNGQPLWAISASAASNSATDSIAASEWSAPTKMLEDGADGLNVATVFLYRRTTGATPALPNANITYTFATGAVTGLTNSWTRDIPTTGGAYLWVTQATASSQGATDVIAHTEWSAVSKLAADGLDGTNARVITLFATKQAIAYRKDGSRDANSINFDTTMQSLSGGIYEFQLQCFRADGTFSPATATSDGSVTHQNLTVSGGSATLNTSSSYSVFNPNNEFVYYRMRVRYLVGGVSQAEDVVSIGKVYDGSEAITVILSNEAHTLPANSTGAVSSMVGSGTTIKVYQGANLLTFRGVGTSGSSYPTQNSSFTINRTYSANMRNAGSMTGDGTTTATQPDYGNVVGDGSMTDWTEFTIRIRDADGRELPAITKRQTLSKTKQGADGVDGSVGAGFYGATYANIDWTTSVANARFTTLVGRPPVNLDIFTQTTSSSSQARQYNGSSWAAVALQVNGSIIASNTIAGDRFIAGTEISGPIIKGGELIAVGPSTEFFEVIRPEPFGPQSDLVNWFGPKLNGITWNNTTGLPIYSGMTKANAKTYKTKNGSVYFGGTIIAGVLRNAVQTSLLTATPSIESGVFGSNGGDIFMSVGLSAVRSTSPTSGFCPTNPVSNPPTGAIYLDRWNGTAWVTVASQAITGEYQCSEEDQEHIESWNLSGSFTYTDTQRTTANRQYRARATHNVPLLPNGTLRLSLVTQED